VKESSRFPSIEVRPSRPASEVRATGPPRLSPPDRGELLQAVERGQVAGVQDVEVSADRGHAAQALRVDVRGGLEDHAPGHLEVAQAPAQVRDVVFADVPFPDVVVIGEEVGVVAVVGEGDPVAVEVIVQRDGVAVVVDVIVGRLVGVRAHRRSRVVAVVREGEAIAVEIVVRGERIAVVVDAVVGTSASPHPVSLGSLGSTGLGLPSPAGGPEQPMVTADNARTTLRTRGMDTSGGQQAIPEGSVRAA
jgi:hypothetical protein